MLLCSRQPFARILADLSVNVLRKDDQTSAIQLSILQDGYDPTVVLDDMAAPSIQNDFDYFIISTLKHYNFLSI
jgi:hypothetical protein